ncbi:MAG: hypothetical protein JST20_14215 [Bacteroidetes bacterium]|nr:hypothetical protein [Bacteroidota bacterium]
MKKTIFISSIIFALAFQSCGVLQSFLPEPYNYYFNRDNRQGVYCVGENLSELDSAEQIADNAVLMYSGATVAMASNLATNFVGDFTVNIKKGNGLRINYRTTSENYKSIPGLAFIYSTSGSWIEENGSIIAQLDSIKAITEQPERIQITNLGKKYSIQVGCDIVYRGITELPATEYMIPSTLSGSTVVVSGIDFVPIRRADKRNTPESRAERIHW